MPTPAQASQPIRHPKYVNSDALAARITELYAYITAATHQFLVLVAEFDEQGYWQLNGVHSCAHWLNWQCGIGMNAAREKVRVARALQGLPKISKAFARGEISYSKVRAITRAATPETEDYLLMFARHGTAYHVEKLVAGYRHVNRLRKAADESTVQDLREVQTRWDDDGCLVVTARLPAEQGAMLLKAMDLALDRQFEAERELKDDANGEEYLAKASPSNKVQAGKTETPIERNKRVASRRADALAEMAEAYLNNEAPRGSSADRYQVVVHVAAEGTRSAEVSKGQALAELCTDMHRGDKGPHVYPKCTPFAEAPGGQKSAGHLTDMPRIDEGPRVSAATSRRIACDCSIVPIFKGIKGEPLSVGRKTRAIPPAILRALWVRDGGCRFPGCTHTRFADGHHIKHWADGGETSLRNLVLLCRHHHGLVHEGRFGCELNRHGAVVFKSPRGNVIPEAFRMTAPMSVHEPLAWFDRNIDCEHINSRTCVTKWTGERCDWDLAVGHLFVEPRETPYALPPDPAP